MATLEEFTIKDQAIETFINLPNFLAWLDVHRMQREF